MSYSSAGRLVTDERVVDDREEWETQEDWDKYQDKVNIDIVDGRLQLAAFDDPDGIFLIPMRETVSTDTESYDAIRWQWEGAVTFGEGDFIRLEEQT